MENRGIVKVSQVRHVFAFFVLGGVDLSDEVFLEVLGLFVRSLRRRKIVRDFEGYDFGIFCFVRSTSRLFLDTRENIGREIFFVTGGRVESSRWVCERERKILISN